MEIGLIVNGIDRSPFPCRRCGKNMKHEDGFSIVGYSVRVEDNREDEKYSAFLKVQMGPFNVGESYDFCFECFIKSFLPGERR